MDVDREVALIRAGYIIAASEVPRKKRQKIMEMMKAGSTAGEARDAVCPDLDYAVIAQIIIEELEK